MRAIGRFSVHHDVPAPGPEPIDQATHLRGLACAVDAFKHDEDALSRQPTRRWGRWIHAVEEVTG